MFPRNLVEVDRVIQIQILLGFLEGGLSVLVYVDVVIYRERQVVITAVVVTGILKNPAADLGELVRGIGCCHVAVAESGGPGVGSVRRCAASMCCSEDC